MKDMNRHPPWVMKDPRMALVMPLWQPYLKDLVCVFVHKDPVKNSISLASNSKKSSQTGAPADGIACPRSGNVTGCDGYQALGPGSRGYTTSCMRCC